MFSSNLEEAEQYEAFWEAVQAAAFCYQEGLREEIIKVLELEHDAVAAQPQHVR